MADVARPLTVDIPGDGIQTPSRAGVETTRDVYSSAAVPSARARLGVDAALAVFVAVLAGAAASIGIQGSLWADELWSVGLARLSLGDYLRHFVWGPESNMVLYTLILHGWLRLAALLGMVPDELAIRLPSAVLSVVATMTVYWLGRRLGGRLTGFVAGSLFTLNYLVLQSAGNDARSYSTQAVAVTLSWIALFTILERPNTSRRWYVLYALATGLAVYAHVLSLLAFMGQGLAVALIVVAAWRRGEPIPAWLSPWLKAAVVASLLATPFLIDAFVHGGSTNNWVWPAHPSDVAHFLGQVSGQQPLFLLAFAIAGTAGVAAAVRWRSQLLAGVMVRGRAVPVIGLICWVFVPIVVSYALTQPRLNLHLFHPRYLVLVVPPMCLLAGLGVASLRRTWPKAVAAACLLLLALLPVAVFGQQFQKQDQRGAAAWVANHYRTGDGVVCLTWGCAVGMDYYQPSLMPSGSPGRIAWSDGRAGAVDASTLAAYVPSHGRVFLVADAENAETRMARDWLGQRYGLVARYDANGLYGPVTVLEYDTAVSSSGS